MRIKFRGSKMSYNLATICEENKINRKNVIKKIKETTGTLIDWEV